MKHLIAVLTVLSMSIVLAGGVEPRLFRSSPERDFRETNGALPSSHTGPGAFVIDLDSAQSTHKFFGVGVSFPEASCHLLMKMPAADRKAVIARVSAELPAPEQEDAVRRDGVLRRLRLFRPHLQGDGFLRPCADAYTDQGHSRR